MTSLDDVCRGLDARPVTPAALEAAEALVRAWGTSGEDPRALEAAEDRLARSLTAIVDEDATSDAAASAVRLAGELPSRNLEGWFEALAHRIVDDPAAGRTVVALAIGLQLGTAEAMPARRLVRRYLESDSSLVRTR
ncbi:MAG TPA: hypothetical protein VGM88_27255 [Kofleriaceae bacterium]